MEKQDLKPGIIRLIIIGIMAVLAVTGYGGNGKEQEAVAQQESEGSHTGSSSGSDRTDYESYQGGHEDAGWYVGPGPKRANTRELWANDAIRWNFHSPPAMDNEGIVYGGGPIGAFDSSTGEPIWRNEDLIEMVPPGGAGYMSIHYHNGSVHIHQRDSVLKVDSVTGEHSGSTPMAFSRNRAVLSDGILYTSDYDTRKLAQAFDLESHTEVWKREFDARPVAPAVVGNLVIIGTREKDGQRARAIAMDRDSGETTWSQVLDFSPYTVLGVDELVVVGGEETMVVLEAESGNEVWRRDINLGRLDPTFAATNRTVFATENRKRIVALDARTGDKLWVFDAAEYADDEELTAEDFQGEEGPLGELNINNIVVADGVVYVNSRITSGIGRVVVIALDAIEGNDVLWSLTGPPDIDATSWFPNRPVVADGRLYYHANHIADPGSRLFVLGDE